VTQPTGTPAHQAVVSLCTRHDPEKHEEARGEETVGLLEERKHIAMGQW